MLPTPAEIDYLEKIKKKKIEKENDQRIYLPLEKDDPHEDAIGRPGRDSGGVQPVHISLV